MGGAYQTLYEPGHAQKLPENEQPGCAGHLPLHLQNPISPPPLRTLSFLQLGQHTTLPQPLAHMSRAEGTGLGL